MSDTCCPTGYATIDSNGYFISNLGVPIKIINLNWYTFVGICCLIVNGSFAVIPDPIVGHIPCACCPVDYVWSSIAGACLNPLTKQGAHAIPCIDCDCVQPPEFECGTCGTLGQPINWNFNFFVKECTDCTPETQKSPCGLNTFTVPAFYDPTTIGFVLKLKNYM